MKKKIKKNRYGIVFFVPVMSFSQVATKKVVFPRGNSGTTITGVRKGNQAIE